MKIFNKMLIFILFAMSGTIAPAKELAVLLDVSASVAYQQDDRVNKLISNRLSQTINQLGLKNGDTVLIRPIGLSGPAHSAQLTNDITISNRGIRANQVAPLLAKLMASQLNRENVDMETSIVFAIDSLSWELGEKPATVIIISDMIESSVDGDLEKGGSTLQQLEPDTLKDKRFIIIGLGYNASHNGQNQALRALRKAWIHFFKNAGVKSVVFK